jgi:hypothetical protein
MSRYIVTLGCTLSAYADITVEAPNEAAAMREARRLALRHAWKDVTFKAAWDSAHDYRVVEETLARLPDAKREGA